MQMHVAVCLLSTCGSTCAIVVHYHTCVVGCKWLSYRHVASCLITCTGLDVYNHICVIPFHRTIMACFLESSSFVASEEVHEQPGEPIDPEGECCRQAGGLGDKASSLKLR